MTELLEVKVPRSGAVENVEISEWLVSVGDVVSEGTSLAEVSTDKVDTELESPFAGQIVKLLADVGDEVPVGTAVVLIAEEGATAADVASALSAYQPSGG